MDALTQIATLTIQIALAAVGIVVVPPCARWLIRQGVSRVTAWCLSIIAYPMMIIVGLLAVAAKLS
jgi:predicted PurR-regulated permease PerM